ncbi:MAG: hypothetical protein KAX49_20945 [Halanaerobiales bacterium]|nr:hypothetical protein [Halanaerobiales bacterium]
MICSLDSRPIYAAVGGFKKECVCSNPDKCTCTPRFSDPDATTGRQLIKVNQNRYFVGYRKNTLNSKVSDQKVLLPSLERLKKIGLSIPYLIADKEFTYSVEENP